MTRDLAPDHRDLVRGSFAQATSALEDAHGVASIGQSHALSTAEYARCAERLRAASIDIEILASAVRVVLYPTGDAGDDQPGGSSESS